jgi:hypothetical protein
MEAEEYRSLSPAEYGRIHDKYKKQLEKGLIAPTPPASHQSVVYVRVPTGPLYHRDQGDQGDHWSIYDEWLRRGGIRPAARYDAQTNTTTDVGPAEPLQG